MSAEPKPPKRASRGTFVELVRLVLVGLFTAGGWQIARAQNFDQQRLLIAVVLGSLVGYVVGGVIGRLTAAAVSTVEQDLRRMPASELLAGVVGLIMGLIIAALASFFLFRLPPAAAYPTGALVALILAYTGYRVGRSKRDDLFGVFGLKTRSFEAAAGEVNVLDTSALIDGRILEVVQAGFVGGTLMVHRGVLAELQSIADSSDPRRRARGQRGLDILRSLQRHPGTEVVLIEEPVEGDVDSTLVRLARDQGGALVTGDSNLVKVAQALDVPTRSIGALAEAVRPAVLPGEELTLRLTREGREAGQGVGFLDDGTMVVVDRAADQVGSDVRATVTNVLQTASGRMVFARLGGG